MKAQGLKAVLYLKKFGGLAGLFYVFQNIWISSYKTVHLWKQECASALALLVIRVNNAPPPPTFV